MPQVLNSVSLCCHDGVTYSFFTQRLSCNGCQEECSTLPLQLAYPDEYYQQRASALEELRLEVASYD